MVSVVKSIISHIGINPKRLLLDWVSAAEGPRFAQLVTDFTNRLRELGPLNDDAKNSNGNLSLKLKAARNAVKSEKLRWVAAKQTEFKKDGNKYSEVFTGQEIGRMVDGVVIEEIALQQILLLLEQEKLSVKEISQRLGISSPKIMEQMLGLRRKEIIKIAEIRGRSPLYALR